MEIFTEPIYILAIVMTPYTIPNLNC